MNHLAYITFLVSALAVSSSSSAQGGWSSSPEDALLPLDNQLGDNFGAAVAIDDDLLVVGAPGKSTALVGFQGAAYVYRRTGTVWRPEALLDSDSSTFGEMLASSIAIDQERVVLGGPSGLAGPSDDGGVSVFDYAGGTWVESARLPAPGISSNGDGFGASVAVRSDTIAAGAVPFFFQEEVGNVVVYRDQNGIITMEALLDPATTEIGQRFGASVALGADILFAGAPNRVVSNGTGAVDVFARVGSVWSPISTLTAPASAGTVGSFGSSLVFAGDTLLVGTPTGGVGGYVFAYRLSGTTLTLEATLSFSGGQAFDFFGKAIDLAGEVALIGLGTQAPGRPTAVLFTRFGQTWTERATFTSSAGGTLGLGAGAVAIDGLNGVIGEYKGGATSASAQPYALAPSAGSLLRNAGSNPMSYTVAADPILGANFQGSVDLGGTTGHSLALLVGFATPADSPLAGGATLLVNANDPSGELLTQAPQVGPVASFTIAVPNDLTLAGLQLATQAIHFGAVSPFALSNAQDLQLGF